MMNKFLPLLKVISIMRLWRPRHNPVLLYIAKRWSELAPIKASTLDILYKFQPISQPITDIIHRKSALLGPCLFD